MERTGKRRRNDILSIPATIRIRLDNGKRRVFRRRELEKLLWIPEGTSEKRREAHRMASSLGFWNYYVEVYKSRYEVRLQRYQEFEASRKEGIERYIRQHADMGPEFVTDANVARTYYSFEDVREFRERLEAARHKHAILKAIADALRVKDWNLRALLPARNEH